MKVETITSNSPHLGRVKELHRAHSKTLGMFPNGAFDEYAALKRILLATDDGGQCVGYLLYRSSKDRAMLVHLCIDNAWKKKGVGKSLITELTEITKARGLKGIGLWCRRDFEASKAWPRYGFVPFADKPGKSLDGSELTFWWLDHKQPDLFQTASATQSEEPKTVAVIDANVFFDMYDDVDPESEESKFLLADWLQDSVEFCVTDEIFTEINRHNNKKLREQQRVHAHRHRLVAPPCQDFEAAKSALRKFFPDSMNTSGLSDFYQLSKTIAGDIQFFVTRDEGLLKMADAVFEVFNISILRPSDLINHIDSLRRESEYQPVRLGGSGFKIHLVKAEQEQLALAKFQASGNGESSSSFLKILRNCLCAPGTIQCWIAESEAAAPMVLFAHDRSCPGVLKLPLLRVARGSLAPTLGRHILAQALQFAARENRTVTVVTEARIDPVLVAALQETGFVSTNSGWIKLSIGVADYPEQITKRLNQIAQEHPFICPLTMQLSDMLKTPETASSSANVLAMERALWPAKLLGIDVPTFIVPIQPFWAQSLFDEGLSNQELFGSRPELALKRELVYYRAKNPSGITAPGRIFWYVSSNDQWEGTMSIRACSRLDEIIIGKPKELFRRFRRLGIYEWHNVFELANHDLNKEIMALRFSDTELLPSPVTRDRFRKLGIASNLQSPLRIDKDLFAKIYQLGIVRP